ncbi:hypothetical protein BU24DRAFT_480128 [Aaosphaeria arxii CBS 175.79]|uniref:Cytochrome b561 domain-containing protein n=1 Tax=Aaosphaeria arxii CBS 175.79 TaxID=1450172 RepID=A0A6A5XQ00_9PLEO|nr:uncharacterized protein BU24DRAFT_480128 [Aaosphaeria arxii CBS 175.79]KAF2015328.1 hypothetical protein BU24DRAFT_480128 [Aaosphaeria arxii CBS 175.79]
MSIAVSLWFPLGVLLLRLLKVKNTVLWHAIWQGIGLVLLLVGFGLGSWLSSKTNHNGDTHIILGIVISVLFLFMPAIGWFHHRHFSARGNTDYKRHIHVWGGRVLLLLGVINGGTGLSLSKAPTSGMIAYGILTAVVGIGYGYIWFRKGRQPGFERVKARPNGPFEMESGTKA